MDASRSRSKFKLIVRRSADIVMAADQAVRDWLIQRNGLMKFTHFSLTTMASKYPSLSALFPSSTPRPPLYAFPVPSFLSNIQGHSFTWLYTTLAIVFALLVLEQSVYRYKKGHLPGDKWTIPVIGKFADSMSPSIEGYKKQWDSGALSAISVFNM